MGILDKIFNRKAEAVEAAPTEATVESSASSAETSEGAWPHEVVLTQRPRRIIPSISTGNYVLVQSLSGSSVMICDAEGNTGHKLDYGQSLPLMTLDECKNLYAKVNTGSGAIGVLLW
jgi:hypothetical protein